MISGAAAAPTGRLPSDAVAHLAAYQRRVGAGDRAESNVALLSTEGTLAVATGQQPGLFGGPLLTLHKAATAVARADALARATGRPVVPVFWIASEDHDVAEIDRAVVLDAAGVPRALSLGLVPDRKSAADARLEPAALARLMAELAAALPATDRAAEAVALARPPAEADLGSWFATILARVLGDSGLVFVEPYQLAPYAGDVYAMLLERAETIEAGVRAEGVARRARGEAAPLERAAGTAPLFLRDAPRGVRGRVTLDGNSVRVRDRVSTLDRRLLMAVLRQEPELASGDVVGRVFVQNALLPVVEIVAGPTELAYLTQVGAGARAVERPFPVLVPRASALWLDGKSVESLKAFGFDAVAVAEGRTVPPAATSDAGPDALSEELDGLLRRATEVRDAAVSALGADGGSSVVARDLEAVRGGIERARAHRRDEREALLGRGKARYERLVNALRPIGEPQERVLSPLSLIARHGVGALGDGLNSLGSADGARVIRLP